MKKARYDMPRVCAICGRNGPEAVHRNAEVKRRLQEEWQEKLMEDNGWTVEDFRLIFGKSYIGEDDDVQTAVAG